MAYFKNILSKWLQEIQLPLLEKRNLSLQNSIDDFEKELPKHESFPTSKDMLMSYIGIYQNEIHANLIIIELLRKADEILLRYDIEN